MGKLTAKFTLANWKKTIYYLRRNGLKNTFHAAMERLYGQIAEEYTYEEPKEDILAAQKARVWSYEPLFSILVPVYRTPQAYLTEMIESVLNQTYGRLELILADATEDDSVEKIIRSIMAEESSMYGCERIKYVHLENNAGISENSNRALDLASGDYVGLLDHDDVLTPDALYRMAEAIESSITDSEKKATEHNVLMLYSDEDKCNQDRTLYYEPHYKTDFNLELLLSNNYICHFLVMKRELMQSLRFRKEYDGAQDFDLVLRAAAVIKNREQIVHIPAVLYHWRCHTGSTAENPQSKQYAYEAGKRAVQDMAHRFGWDAQAYHLKHLGFYGLEFKNGLLQTRSDVGAMGGRLMAHGRILAGAYTKDGRVLYEGLKDGYSGYMHRAVLRQEVDAVDIRLIKVRPECRDLFTEATGLPWSDRNGIFDWKSVPDGTDYKTASLAFAAALRKEGYRILWDPEWSLKI